MRSVTIMAHARGDHGDFDAVGEQALQAEPVVHVERLELVAIVGVDQASVGEHAIDVEDREPDARGAIADVGGEVGREHGNGESGIGNRRTQVSSNRYGAAVTDSPFPIPDSLLVKPPAPATGRECSTRRRRDCRRRRPAAHESCALPSAAPLRSRACRREIVFGRAVIRCVTGVARRSMSSSSTARRRSPSVKTPSRCCSSSTIAVMPRPLRVISTSASVSDGVGADASEPCSPMCMTSLILQQQPAAEAAGRMRAREILVGEAARFEQRDRERIAHDQRRRRARGRREAERAGFGRHAGVQMHVGHAAPARIRGCRSSRSAECPGA